MEVESASAMGSGEVPTSETNFADLPASSAQTQGTNVPSQDNMSQFLLQKIRQLEESQKKLEEELSKLIEMQKTNVQIDTNNLTPSACPLCRCPCSSQLSIQQMSQGGHGVCQGTACSTGYHAEGERDGLFTHHKWDLQQASSSSRGLIPGDLSERHLVNVLQSMGQAVYIFLPTGEVTYWNRSAEDLYGWTASEAIGKNILDLVVDDARHDMALQLVSHLVRGESWSGQFPLKKKTGEVFIAMMTDTPLYDRGEFVGIIGVSSDTRPFRNSIQQNNTDVTHTFGSTQIENGLQGLTKPKSDKQQSLTMPFKNTMSKVASKVLSRLRTSENGEVASTHDHDSSHMGTGGIKHDGPSFVNAEEGATVSKIQNQQHARSSALTSKAEAWMPKGLRHKLRSSFQSIASDQNSREQSNSPYTMSTDSTEQSAFKDGVMVVRDQLNGETVLASPGSSISSQTANTPDSNLYLSTESEPELEGCEISWEDLDLRDQIGEGMCGRVFHGIWFGSDVAVKVFICQEYSTELLADFRKEVAIMRRLRHPNVLLFMGAVYSPQHLSIVTEFMPRGSLFRLLHKSSQKIDWKRRLSMVIDVARGMNYLHHRNPPIIHRDLKSSNLLVDRNWTVKVGDFGLSRMKHASYVTSRPGNGTPQWMAPEVLRNERSNEKADVYSFGVILWEVATEQIPWNGFEQLEIVGLVGVMNRRLDIPQHLDPKLVSIMEDCWHSDPALRPTFEEILERMRELARQTRGSTQKAA